MSLTSLNRKTKYEMIDEEEKKNLSMEKKK